MRPSSSALFISMDGRDEYVALRDTLLSMGFTYVGTPDPAVENYMGVVKGCRYIFISNMVFQYVAFVHTIDVVLSSKEFLDAVRPNRD